jgi:CheY-like chemotaxis protein
MAQIRRSACVVLVVDDDAGLRESIRALLSSMGYVVSTAANSGEALLELGALRPDVVLTDIYMYGGDGFELINAMRSFGHEIPIVAMSGGMQPFGVADQLGIAQRLGATATIAKPFRAAHLVETIDRAVANRLVA